MEEVLRKLARGEISVEEAVRTLKLFAIEKIGEFARIDVGRELRRGIPEIILAEGKSLEELSEIVFRSIETAGRVIVSRLDGEIMDKLAEKARRRGLNVEEYREARMLVVRKTLGRRETGGRVGVITAGTADIPVAEEASIIAEEMGCKYEEALRFHEYTQDMASVESIDHRRRYRRNRPRRYPASKRRRRRYSRKNTAYPAHNTTVQSAR